MKSQPLLFLYGNPFLSPQLLFLIFSFPFSFSYARAWRHTTHTHAVKRERGRANTGVQYSESHLTVVIEIHGRIHFQILNSIFTAWWWWWWRGATTERPTRLKKERQITNRGRHWEVQSIITYHDKRHHRSCPEELPGGNDYTLQVCLYRKISKKSILFLYHPPSKCSC